MAIFSELIVYARDEYHGRKLCVKSTVVIYIYIYAIKAIQYNTFYKSRRRRNEKDTRKFWHVAGVYVGRTIFVSLRLYVYVILIAS